MAVAAPTMPANDADHVMYKYKAYVEHFQYWDFLINCQVLNKREHYGSPKKTMSNQEILIIDIFENELPYLDINKIMAMIPGSQVSTKRIVQDTDLVHSRHMSECYDEQIESFYNDETLKSNITDAAGKDMADA